MTCRLMSIIENEFKNLSYKDKEIIRSIVCGDICNGVCKDDYIIKSEKRQ